MGGKNHSSLFHLYLTNKNMKKKILLIVSTHGDEAIGIDAVKKLKDNGLNSFFDCLIANPAALRNNKRYIDKDLNRVYPGEKNSRFYEERIAYKNIRIAKKYRYIIDIHEASKGRDDFIIVPRENISPYFPFKFIDLKRVILWPDPKGPVSQVLKNAIELEFGMKQRKRIEVVAKAVKIIENFIKRISSKERKILLNSKKEIYFTYGKLMKKDLQGGIQDFRDFQKIKVNQEKFYPLLSGQYLKQGIVCYKMKKLED